MTDLFLQSLRNNYQVPKKKDSLHRGCSGTLHAHAVPKVKREAPCPCPRDRPCVQNHEEVKEDYYKTFFGHSRCYSTRSLSSQSSTSSSGSDSSGYTSDKNAKPEPNTPPKPVKNTRTKDVGEKKKADRKKTSSEKKHKSNISPGKIEKEEVTSVETVHKQLDPAQENVKNLKSCAKDTPKKKTPEFILPYLYKGCYLYGRALSVVEEEDDESLSSDQDSLCCSPASSRACTPTKLERVNTLHNLSLLHEEYVSQMPSQPSVGSRSCHACQIIFDLPPKVASPTNGEKDKTSKKRNSLSPTNSRLTKSKNKAKENGQVSPSVTNETESISPVGGKFEIKSPTKSKPSSVQERSPKVTPTTTRGTPPLKKSASDGVQNAVRDKTILRTLSDSQVLQSRQKGGKELVSPKNIASKKPSDTKKSGGFSPSPKGKVRTPSGKTAKEKRNTPSPEAKSDEELSREKAWLTHEKAWLSHNSGFSLVAVLNKTESESIGSPLPDEKRRVRLESGEVIEVDEDELEKANPPSFDRSEDLASLHFLNEASVLHTLRQRFAASLIHTNAGPATIIINPSAPLAVHSERMIHLFRGCKPDDMPPHIYSVTQAAYRQMLSTRRDQAVVFTGRSGGGKTFNFRHSLHYLCVAAGSVNKVLTVEKLNAICLLLEAFGNCKTSLNSNATRFTEIFSLDFDQSGQIGSASVQVLMPEYQRVSRRPKDEPTFHIFYEMIAGCSEEVRKQLFLDVGEEPCAFLTPLQRQEDKLKASTSWSRVISALDLLGVKPSEAKVIWSVLAAIYHLGVAGATKGTIGKGVFVKPQAALRAATLLGISLDDLTNYTFQVSLSSGISPFRSSPSTERTSAFDKKLEPYECLEGIAHGLYLEVFTALVTLINRSISTSTHCISSLLLFDSPGFQNGATCRQTGWSGATFGDLQHNYLQERLQQLFYDVTVGATKDKYAQENIEFPSEIDADESPPSVARVLDTQPLNPLARSSLQNLKEAGKRGLLWMLDEESLVTNVSDEELVKRVLEQFSDKDSEKVITRGPSGNQLVIRHLQGTNPVLYTVSSWLKLCRENPVIRNATSLLQESSREDISVLFSICRGPVPLSVSGSVGGLEGGQSLRRVTSMRRTFTSGTAGIKRKSIPIQLKYQMDAIVELLRKSHPHFVHCLLPQHSAGVSNDAVVVKVGEECMNVPLLRSQVRGAQILPALRLHKLGFPDQIAIEEFCRRFSFVLEAEGKNKSDDQLEMCRDILLVLGVEPSAYKIGLSQIFFRAGALSKLETQRDDQITGKVTRLQAVCRGYLARKRLERLKIEDTAVRCIQRNVRKLLGVREWPWWRLLVKLHPLMNVHRTEEELRSAVDELTTLRARVASLEKDKTDLKIFSDKLEIKVSELTTDLAEEHSTAVLATERLEAETSERLKLEKDVKELQAKLNSMTQDHDRLEFEVLCSRASHLGANSTTSDDLDAEADAAVYKHKYERCARDLEFMKEKLRTQHEDDLDQMVTIKKQLEKKLADAYEEVEEQRQVAAQWKRKAQRLGQEANDTKLLLEEQGTRNAVLEKKQRKFDGDMQVLQEEIRQDRSLKEKLQREREMALAEKEQIERDLQSAHLELEMRGERISALQREVEALSADGKSDTEVAAMRRAKLELENKVKDQEEELDDLAGQVQMLESAKVRLELQLENLRKDYKRELASKDDEVEDVRCSAQKKVKAIEAQLEAEHDERTTLVREKHDLERRLLEMTSLLSQSTNDEVVHKLKKELKKYKALLKDAQVQLEHAKSETPSKVLLRQLKNQLEDAEFARTAAVKGRQHAEQELQEMQIQYEELQKLRNDAEDKYLQASRERSNLQTQLDDLEAEMSEVMRKYKSTVQQLSIDQLTIQDQAAQIANLEQEKQALKESLAELNVKLENMEGDTMVTHAQKRLELKIKELESKAELELTSRQRLETQISRLKESLEKSAVDLENSRTKEQVAQDTLRRLQRQLRDLREELSGVSQRDTDASQKVRELEQAIDILEGENEALKRDLNIALRRIDDLQSAMQGDSESHESDAQLSDSDSDDSLATVDTLLSSRRPLPGSGQSQTSISRRNQSRSPSPVAL